MATATCYTWNEADFTWEGNEYTWDNVCLVIDIVTGGAGNAELGYAKLNKKKKEEFITLLLKIKGETDIKQTKKKNKNIKVTSKDIDIVITEVLKGIKVNL